jgi:ABC-type uncharacterized transport system ATPase subunit
LKNKGKAIALEKFENAILFYILQIKNHNSDRIALIYRGELVAIFDAQTATIEEIGLRMAGGTP